MLVDLHFMSVFIGFSRPILLNLPIFVHTCLLNHLCQVVPLKVRYIPTMSKNYKHINRTSDPRLPTLLLWQDIDIFVTNFVNKKK